jgi:hypothetical protein
MFYIYDEIPELLQFLPREIWLKIQQDVFIANRNAINKSMCIKRAKVMKFGSIFGNYTGCYRKLLLKGGYYKIGVLNNTCSMDPSVALTMLYSKPRYNLMVYDEIFI